MRTTEERHDTNNRVILEGHISTLPEVSHEMYGEKFYLVYIDIPRQSNTIDTLPLLISERLMDLSTITVGQTVRITGQIRTYNKHNEETGKIRLMVQVFVQEYEELEELKYGVNTIDVSGFLCRKPNYRVTPLGREICDINIAVNRPYGKSDYIPCICWGRNAMFSEKLEVGTAISVSGRLQSRQYNKRVSPDSEEFVTCTAYELSISRLNIEQ